MLASNSFTSLGKKKLKEKNNTIEITKIASENLNKKFVFNFIVI